MPAFAQLRCALSDGCAALAKALDSFRRAPASDAACLGGHTQLWSWQPGFESGRALAEVHKEQAMQAAALCAAAKLHAQLLPTV